MLPGPLSGRSRIGARIGSVERDPFNVAAAGLVVLDVS
jgi:hypothetical protein